MQTLSPTGSFFVTLVTMAKDFDTWNKQKKNINGREHSPLFHEREVWWCSLGLNIGYEQDGGEIFERPVLVIKKFSKDILWILPLTNSHKQNQYYIKLATGTSSIVLSQLRLISAKRLERFLYKLPEDQFAGILIRLQGFFPRY